MAKLIPFKWLPGSWGLRGKVYDRAEAMYLYEGLELQNKLLEIDFDPKSVEYAIRKIELSMEAGEITEQDMEKEIATLKQEPWVGGDVVYQGDGGIFFDLDWNHLWIEELKANGYTGSTEDEIMRKYFAALCYSEMLKESDDMDPFLYESTRASLNKLRGKE